MKSLIPASPPPGYPRAFERAVSLADGRIVFIRPILPSDAPELAKAVRDADPATLRRRFLGGPPPMNKRTLAHLTEVDYVRRFALVALDPRTGYGVAIARYEPLEEGTAEVAVAVDPGWRGVHLATMLIEMLAEAALDRGVTSFSASYLADNLPVVALLADADGIGRQRIRQGIAEVSIPFDRAQVEAAKRRLT